MGDESSRNWKTTYLSVIAVEVLWLLGLWWLGNHFGA
jgi:hypothetical protein